MSYINTRLRKDVHKKVKLKAVEKGLSINDYIKQRVSEDFDLDCSKTKKNEKAKFKFNW